MALADIEGSSGFLNPSPPIPFTPSSPVMDSFSFATPNLPLVAVVIGIVLTGSHLFALLAPELCINWARAFPRSRIWGTVLLAVVIIWAVLITATTDLGEFSPMRPYVVGGLVAGGVLLWKFVPDFLSSRSTGFLLLLAAHPVLETTFLQSGMLKTALVVLAYAWALAGLFYVGMPYLQRDIITWVCAARWRWTMACWAGLLYGLLLLVDGVRLELMG